eukprot:CAMPEP_0182580848 /NCGR_PEP_ID=MMETSP1324-20130603/48247_1 /TAXON_ID=236786 /ORGANISM="Florenciella sp., Strain RCC1587" /LENGTH=68 /DNA_ID=CAMNT_0024797135 /DNA_START=129 /DNA_END=332 /DNA_ORIENTATION=+
MSLQATRHHVYVHPPTNTSDEVSVVVVYETILRHAGSYDLRAGGGSAWGSMGGLAGIFVCRISFECVR